MVDEIKLRKQRAEGEHAKRLLEDKLIEKFFSDTEKEVMDAWRNSGGKDEDVRERAYLMMRLHANLKQRFIATMGGGTFAANELLEIERAATKEMKR